MNHVIVKLKIRGKSNKYRKLISDISLYNMPDNLKDAISYTPAHNLDEDSWFVISEFSKKEYCISLLLEDFVSTEFEVFDKDDFSKLDFLVSYQENNLYYFQKISRMPLLSKRTLCIGDVVQYRENSKEIIIKELPDAIYLKDKDKLYFKKLSAITGIFKGIDILYREATENETKEFLNNDFIQLESGFSVEHVKQANRRRIAMAIDTINTCGKKKKKIIFDAIKEYCPTLVTESNKFKVSSESDLKLLLYGIDQRFYTTPDGEEKRIANSIIKLTTG